jgi:predicted MFS family arabinose efflux permease
MLPIMPNAIKMNLANAAARPSTRGVWPLLLAVAAVGSNSLALSPILSDVARDLAATAAEAGRAGAAYGAATALSALLLAPGIDRVGARHALLLALPVLSLALLGSAAVTGWLGLALAQGLAGLAGGVILPATYALATSTAPRGQEAQALGRVLTGWSASLVAGVPLSAWVAGLASWRASFLLLALAPPLAAGLLWRLGAVEGREAMPAGAPLGRRLLGAARRPGVVALLVVCLLFMTAFYGAYAYLGDHARGALGLSSGEAGWVVLAYGLGFGLATLGDRAVDRVGAARLFPAVLALVAAVYLLLAPSPASLAALLAVAALWGFANHFGLNILVLLLSRAGGEARGAVLSLNSAVTYLGTFLGAGGLGAVYGAWGYGPVAVAAAGLCGGAALVAWAALGRQG